MKLLKAIQLERAKLLKAGFVPKDRSDTGINILQLMKDYNIDETPALKLLVR